MVRKIIYTCDRCGKLIPQARAVRGGFPFYMLKVQDDKWFYKLRHYHLCQKCGDEFWNWINE